MVLRRIGAVSVMAVVLVGSGATARAATFDAPCDNTGDNHCYAIRSQGLNFDGTAPTLSNVTSTTAWVRANCQYASDAGNGFANSEIWQGTTSDLSGGRLEWVETGITTGTFNQVPYGANVDFFWARQHGSGTNGIYDEYLLLGSDPAVGTNYIVSIRYVAGRGWRIFHGSNEVGGGSANAAPGARQWVEAGAETRLLTDGNSGAVSHISRVTSGTTINGLTGHVVFSQTGYNIATAGSTEIRFATDSSAFSTCRAVPAAVARTRQTGQTPDSVAKMGETDAARTQVARVVRRQQGTSSAAGYVVTTAGRFEVAFPEQAGVLTGYLAPSSPIVVTKVTGRFTAPLRHPAGTPGLRYDTVVSVWSPQMQRTVANSYSLGTAPDLGVRAAQVLADPYLDLRRLGTVRPLG